MGTQTPGSRFVRREILLFVIAAAASFAFLNHDNLYLQGRFRLIIDRIEPYLLVTAVAYLFLRAAVIAIELRPPRVHAELVRCPECGQWIDDRSAAGLAAHSEAESARKVAPKVAPKVTPMTAVTLAALRKAVEATHSLTPAPETEEGLPAPSEGTAPRIAGRDLVKALSDTDFLERIGHAPRPPEDRRFKR
ncbi:MAG: hypothetical protein E6K19_08380 [Methanobacteriota archaeon]|nr:MAG: hypothetical protein E6K19_08380 [Euryarchaeota archaeon]